MAFLEDSPLLERDFPETQTPVVIVNPCDRTVNSSVPKYAHSLRGRSSLSKGTGQLLGFLSFQVRESLTRSLGPSLQPARTTVLHEKKDPISN